MVKARQQARQSNRPLSVTLLTWGVFLLGLVNAWRAVALFKQSKLLLNLGATLDPRLRMFFALIWALVFLAISLSIWRRWKAARFVTPIFLILYAAYQFGLIRFFSQTFGVNDNWQTDIVLYTAALIFTIWALNHKDARNYFG
jgi:hypothetical protein